MKLLPFILLCAAVGAAQTAHPSLSSGPEDVCIGKTACKLSQAEEKHLAIVSNRSSFEFCATHFDEGTAWYYDNLEQHRWTSASCTQLLFQPTELQVKLWDEGRVKLKSPVKPAPPTASYPSIIRNWRGAAVISEGGGGGNLSDSDSDEGGVFDGGAMRTNCIGVDVWGNCTELRGQVKQAGRPLSLYHITGYASLADGGDCTHPPIAVFGVYREDALVRSGLSPSLSGVTVWNEKEWEDHEKNVDPASFKADCDIVRLEQGSTPAPSLWDQPTLQVNPLTPPPPLEQESTLSTPPASLTSSTLSFDDPKSGRIDRLSDDEYAELQKLRAAVAAKEKEIAKAHGVALESVLTHKGVNTCLADAPFYTCDIDRYSGPDAYEYRGQYLLVNVPLGVKP
jgi:hypothetical protein